MEIRLLKNWAGYPPGKIVFVSEKRAKYLVEELKIAKYTVAQVAKNEAAAKEAKESKKRPPAKKGA